KENDELVDVAITKAGDEVVLSTARGMAIRFPEANARPMGRNTSGVKGIKLGSGDALVGMVVADPEATLLTVCQNGYGKRTFFGPNNPEAASSELAGDEAGGSEAGGSEAGEPEEDEIHAEAAGEEHEGEEAGEEGANSGQRYRTQRRGGKGLRDIKTTDRNGPVVSIASVRDDDELLMMTARGKIQRIVAGEISVIGRNTQGVRIMTLDDDDTLAAAVRVPRDEGGEEEPEGQRDGGAEGS
ncbi:MAG TPA: DNA gyrase C-terminal beta-propeller domain-containing protein, partial [Pirellulales bacterium]|nr:DNA gyrase C-terminal beta-propeller domain-containing protein [Pirellulales bacterium]